MDPRLRGGDDEKGRPVPPVPSFPRKRESTDVRALFRASSAVIPAQAGIHLGRQDLALGFCVKGPNQREMLPPPRRTQNDRCPFSEAC